MPDFAKSVVGGLQLRVGRSKLVLEIYDIGTYRGGFAGARVLQPHKGMAAVLNYRLNKLMALAFAFFVAAVSAVGPSQVCLTDQDCSARANGALNVCCATMIY